ncbi:MAG: diguanylate cyclase domain-containing protein [Christensenellales bacterium]
MREIYIIDDEKELKCELQKKFARDKMFKFKRGNMQDLDSALKDIPALIIINEDGIQEDVVELCRKIRDNDDNAITPIIVISSNQEKEHKWEILKATASYVIKTPIDIEMMYYTIVNIIELLYINRKVSPLTSLPGNVQIQAEMKKRLAKKEYFVMLYIDLDNFKAYNDVYGFSAGDEMIKFTARTIVNNVHKNEEDNNFVGHIGGDDFIAIVEDRNYEEICQGIVAEFDKGVSKYFNKEDIEKGYLEVPNRKGIIEEFPITSISIGAVEVDVGRFNNTLEIGEVGAQVKHLSKTIQGSTYVINRRQE